MSEQEKKDGRPPIGEDEPDADGADGAEHMLGPAEALISAVHAKDTAGTAAALHAAYAVASAGNAGADDDADMEPAEP